MLRMIAFIQAENKHKAWANSFSRKSFLIYTELANRWLLLSEYSKSTFVFMRHSFPPISSRQYHSWNQLHQFIQPPFKRTGRWFWSDSLDPLLNRCFLYKYVLFLNILSYYFRLIEHLSSTISGTYGGIPDLLKYN